jgi:hypothetical protein
MLNVKLTYIWEKIGVIKMAESHEYPYVWFFGENHYQNGEYFYNLIENTGKYNPLYQGIKLEIDFATAISKIPFIESVEIIKNSGRDIPNFEFDVLARSLNCYAFDVKGTDGKRIYAEITPEYMQKKLESKECIYFKAQGYFAFPKHKAEDLTNPYNWYIHKIEPKSYLFELHSKPFYPKLVENSICLIDLPKLTMKEKEYNEGIYTRLYNLQWLIDCTIEELNKLYNERKQLTKDYYGYINTPLEEFTPLKWGLWSTYNDDEYEDMLITRQDNAINKKRIINQLGTYLSKGDYNYIIKKIKE